MIGSIENYYNLRVENIIEQVVFSMIMLSPTSFLASKENNFCGIWHQDRITVLKPGEVDWLNIHCKTNEGFVTPSGN